MRFNVDIYDKKDLFLIFNKNMKSLICIVFLCFNALNLIGQQEKKSFTSQDSLYNSNIKKSKLYGVYIPRDLDDALIKLMELTTPEARKPLLKADENLVAKKLHFGLGRWMEYNWNFAEGSRFSHSLKLKGINYTEDMTRFMLISFHRFVTKNPLDSDKLVQKIILERNEKIKLEQSKMPVIHTETKEIPKKG